VKKNVLRKVSDEIPTASMADITFLLIVYFMVTTTFSATRGLDFALPKEDDTPPVIEKEESVLIEIQPSGQYVVDGRPMPLNEILDYLKPKRGIEVKNISVPTQREIDAFWF
jgi:biopolymer transport protein ExbD